MRNICFSLVMLSQALFWTYMLIPAFTNASSNENAIHGRLREINMNPEENLMDFKIPINLPVNPPQKVYVKKEPVQSLNLDGDDHPKGGYLQDLDNHIKDDDSAEENIKLDGKSYQKYLNPELHHTILPRDASVIWKSSFLRNPLKICSRHSDLDLLVIVHTAPYNFRRRLMIRQEIGNGHMNRPYTLQPVFMLGSTNQTKRNGTKENMLQREFDAYDDIVKMDFTEDFRNLSLKAVMWLKWTKQHCQNAKMILKIDDDVVIDIKKILPLSRGLFSKYNRSIFCHLNKIGSQPIPRKGRTKVDRREFQRMAFYPYNYCSGFIVFLTADLIPLLETTARRIPFYNVDDVFLFGMVPRFMGGVTYHNIGFNVSIWNTKVLICNLERGLECPYFGTMGEEEEVRQKLWNVMRKNHARDFQFPQLHLL